MKNKTTLSLFLVLAFCLVFSQSTVAQERGSEAKLDDAETGLSEVNRLLAPQTRELMSRTLLGHGTEIVGDDKQLFLINFDQPMGIMKDASNPDNIQFWYVVLTQEAAADETEAQTILAAEPALPEEFALSQNYPNPFNPSTTIKFQLPDKNGLQPIRTVLKIYDILGRQVRTVVDEEMPPGFYTKQWDGLNDRGIRISTGVYFYTLTAGEFRDSKKMLMIK